MRVHYEKIKSGHKNVKNINICFYTIFSYLKNITYQTNFELLLDYKYYYTWDFNF